MEQNPNVPRSQKDYITQVQEKIEERVTKTLSQEFSKTENRMLGALSRLDHSLMNPLIQGHSGTAPKISRYTYGTNPGTNEDDSQRDTHPEAGLLQSHTTRHSGPEVGHDMVTGVYDEVTYCSPSTSSGKQENNRSTSQPQFHIDNTTTPLRRSRQTNLFWPFSSWQTSTSLQFFITISTDFPSCQNRSPQRRQHLTGNLGSSSSLKIFSREAQISQSVD